MANGVRQKSPRGALAEKPTESIWYLRSISYGDYRQTVHWRKRRDAYRAILPWNECALCGLDEREHEFRIVFHVHHLSYARLGYELDSDLVLLCSACHNLVHRPQSAAAQHWLEVRAYENPDLEEKARQFLPPELDP